MVVTDPGLTGTQASTSKTTWRLRMRRFAFESILIFGAVQAYRLVRMATRGSHDDAIRNGLDILRFERVLGIDLERGAQSLVLDRRFLVDVFNTIYVWGFWSVVAATLLLLFVVDRRRFRHYRNALFVSGAVGLAVFAVLPVAPPRM